MNLRSSGMFLFAFLAACGGAEETPAPPALVPIPPPVPAPDPNPPPIEGHWGSTIGDLRVMDTGRELRISYSAVFGVQGKPRTCSCMLIGKKDEHGYSLDQEGARLDRVGSRLNLSGTLDCCGAGWPGDLPEWRGDLQRCQVGVQRAYFLADSQGMEVLGTWIPRGGRVTVLPSVAPGAESIYVRHRGTSGTTYGYLWLDSVGCEGA